MARQTESPTGGERKINTQVVDQVKEPNSGVNDYGFYRPIGKFNSNGEMKSPTTSSETCRPSAQKIKIPKGIGGKIGGY